MTQASALVARIHAAADAEEATRRAEVPLHLPDVTDLLDQDCGALVTVTVTVGTLVEHRTHQGRDWASALLADLSAELLVFPKPYDTCRDLLNPGAVLTVTGRVDRRPGGLLLSAHTINPIGDPR